MVTFNSVLTEKENIFKEEILRMNRRKYITVVIFSLILILFVNAFTSVLASGVEDIKNQISDFESDKDDIEDELNSLKADIEAQKAEGDRLTAEAAEILKKKQEQASELEKMLDDLDYIYEQLAQYYDSIKQAEKDYNEALEKFYNRARIMYQYTQFDSLKLFVESKDFFDFTNRDKLFSKMMENDRKELEELTIMKEDLEAKKEIQEKLKLDAEALVAEKKAVIAAIENEEKVVLSQLEESKDALDVLESQEEAMLEESDKIAAEIKALEKEYQKRLEEEKKASQSSSSSSPSSGNHPSFDDGGSGLLWPSRCTKISSYFGMRFHPIYHYYKMHKGIDIGASYGTDIYASEDGIVTNVSYNKGGYGWYIVVYHGDGLSTLYAHCSKVIAEEGQSVTRGQVIALVGSTGASTGPHIHYEVRKNGDPVNPLNYVSP